VSQTAADAIAIAVVFLGAVAFPWLVMSAFVPTLEQSGAGRSSNYRGRTVVLGLGLVWVVWSVGLAGAVTTLDVISRFTPPEGSQPYSVLAVQMPFLLILGAFALGFADDVFGSSAERGFRGHLRALSQGRLTTGGLKLFGVGLLAAVAVGSESLADFPLGTLRWVLAVLSIALTANLLNLMDLRPGRALKVYSLLAVLACALIPSGAGVPTAIQVLIVLLGPVIAVWRFDLGERAMLGDAGANAAGALVGWMAALLLGAPWQLAAYVIVVLALNVASERVSFSRIIEGNRALSWLDGLGRLKAGADEGEEPNSSRNPQLGENKSPM
jgi:hypothetical protein